jgi:hypothetical protein
MSTTETVINIVEASPQPGVGYHGELHVEPFVRQGILEENAKRSFTVCRETREQSREYFMGLPLIVDPGVTFAEVHIVPNCPKKQGIFDKTEAWLEEHGL